MEELTDDVVVMTGGLIDDLETAANKMGATIYNICQRNAGWGIQFHDWKTGLIMHCYYPTLYEAVRGELSRICAAQPSVAGDGKTESQKSDGQARA